MRSKACDVGNLTGVRNDDPEIIQAVASVGTPMTTSAPGGDHKMSDAGNGRGLGHAHQALEFAVGGEEVVAAAVEVRDRHASIGEDRHGARVAELTRTFTRSAQSPHEPPIRTHHENDLSLHETVEQKELARTVERDIRDESELFPVLARHGAQTVQLLEVDLQRSVLRGELDDLLGTRRSHEQQPKRQDTAYTL
ncbi:MAG: hypothetical protein OXI83_06410 [Gemmatimonadota bacterium]|nr:hypothetical protein [Gemmatimonadota bacterium]